MADAQSLDPFLELLTHAVRAAGDDEALVHELFPGEVLEDLLRLHPELGERAVLDGVDGPVAGRVGERREHVQAPVEEVEAVLGVELLGLRSLSATQMIWANAARYGESVLAALGDAVPVAVHQRLGPEIAEEGQVRIVVVVVETEIPRLDGPAARDVDRRVRLLDRLRPAIHPPELVVLAVEGERLLRLPRAHDQLVRLAVLVAREGRDLAVAEVGVHRRADREAGDEPPAGQDVQHRELLGDADRRVVERDRVADDADRRSRRPAAEPGRDDVGRGHRAVAVLVVFVHADAVEAERVRVLELIHVLVVHGVALLRVVERVWDVDPDGPVLLAEVVGQVRPRHQVEPGEFHASPHMTISARQAPPHPPLSPEAGERVRRAPSPSERERAGGEGGVALYEHSAACPLRLPLLHERARALRRSSVVRSSVDRSPSSRRPSASDIPSPLTTASFA